MPSVPLFGYEPLEAAAPLSLDELVAEFVAPHAQSSNRRHGTAARHLLCWLKLRKIALSEVDDAVLERLRWNAGSFAVLQGSWKEGAP